MATIVFSALGAAAGGALGGSVMGLSSAVIGRAVGATLGRTVDQRILGAGGRAVETGRVDRFRLTGAGEGAPVAQVHGRVRVAGQVIWASRFLERQATSGGSGKGTGPRVTSYSYSVSLAVALCEGEIGRIGRIWADGAEIVRDEVTLRVYPGDEDPLPDPKIEAVEGAAPAYRGVAYVVFEDLDLTPFGNRVPQFSFEVVRPQPRQDTTMDLERGLRAVALMPGTGEYALATTPVRLESEPGVARVVNVNTPLGGTDLTASLDALAGDLPSCEAVSLVVSWFGDDLRCGTCRVVPKVEQRDTDGAEMAWSVTGIGRDAAEPVPQEAGRVIYGGTPTDQSVVQAIQALTVAGQAVTFYPFLLMEQMPGNALPDPYGDATDQPALPWRGRITASVAPGLPGSPDGTAAADQEVAAFFGTAAAEDFLPGTDRVGYQGPAEMSYRRFILHYAHLCALAGGVEAFCIGSELRGLTRIRGAGGGFPAVAALRQLAADVRAILPQAKIGYAADWSEYFGYQPADGSGDVYFNLDPLWADENVDFIGIDNYMPLSDWRDGDDHADAGAGAIYNLGYLRDNVAGGEGYDWYYHAPEAESAQLRTPITDGAYGEPWVFRYKDLRGWWSNPHHERRGGVRQEMPTPWIPQSKPFRFTEMGCAAVDKGTNQPNKFVDPKSSESALPKYSDGRRDDLIQRQYLRAMLSFWSDPANNPVSDLYGGAMVDVARMHAWAWDARPYPQFPGAQDLWADGENWIRGHWLTGRAGARSLDSVVREICARSGVTEVDADALFGVVRGYALDETGGARAALQPLMLAHGFDAAERDGLLVFRSRTGRVAARLYESRLADSDEMESAVEAVRAPDAETAGRIRLSYVAEDGSFDIRTAEAAFPDERSFGVAQSDLPMVLTVPEARAIAERWLAEARVARDRVRFALPPSDLSLGAGDVIELRDLLYRIDRLERGRFQSCEATRIEPRMHLPSDAAEGRARAAGYVAPVPVLPVFLDLPLIRGDEVPHAPRLAATARPWPGSVAVYDAALDEGFQLNLLLGAPATLGVTETALPRARPESWDRGPPLRVRLLSGSLSSAPASLVLSGANMMAIGDGESDVWEVFQFAQADLVAPGIYELSARLRGRRGSEAAMPDLWPAGSRVVLLDNAVRQIDLTPEARGLTRSYRIGPARRGYDDPVYVEARRAFAGVGLRPYAPAHLRAREGPAGLSVTWRRRTRIGGDDWSLRDVPLGESAERYLVRVLSGGAIRREAEVAVPVWTYAAADRAADGTAGPYEIAVAQISDRVGPGSFERITIDG